MKTCKFELKLDSGEVVKFNNELELTQALLEKYKFVSKYGDIVFSKTRSTPMQQMLDIVTENNLKFKELLAKGDVFVTAPKDDYDLEIYECKAPTLGANKFLSSLSVDGSPEVTESGRPKNPVFPIFDKDAYWANRFADWENGIFQPKEKDELLEILGREVTKTEVSERLQIRDTIEDKWKALGKYGNTLHAIMRTFFSETSKGKPVSELTGDVLYGYITDRIPKDEEKYMELTKELIEDTIDYAKTLMSDLKSRFGENAIFLPEIALMTPLNTPVTLKNQETGKMETFSTMVGIIDLMVIDGEGNVQIVDYKTSPKPYNDYDDAKVRTFKYQLAAYRRLVNRAGANLGDKSGLYIAPMLLKGFSHDGDKWVFDKVVGYERAGVDAKERTVLVNLTPEILSGRDAIPIIRNLDPVLPEGVHVKEVPSDTLTYVQSWMTKWFKDFGDRDINKEVILYANKYLNKKNNKGLYQYRSYYPKKVHTADKLEDLYQYIKKDMEAFRKQRRNETHALKNKIATAIKEGKTLVHFEGLRDNQGPDSDWLTHTLEKYINGNWQVSDNFKDLENLGILTMLNKFTGHYEFIKLTSHDVYGKAYINGRKNITGAFQSDIVEDNKTDSLILESTYGNIELMETMLAINKCSNLFRNNIGGIGLIIVVDMLNNHALPATNKELVYNFNALAKLSKMEDNNFAGDDPTIKMLTLTLLVRDHLYEILAKGGSVKWAGIDDKWKDFESCQEELSAAISNRVLCREALMALADKLEKAFPQTRKVMTTPFSGEQEKATKLMQEIYLAIGEIDGYDQRLHINKDAEWWDGIMALRKGHSGMMTDNQGFLSNPALNRLAKATTIAYLNTRDAVLQVSEKLHPLVEGLRKDLNIGWLYERTLFNQTDLYKNLVYYDEVKQDILFRNPDTDPELSTAQRELLRYVIRLVNINRYIPKDQRTNELYIIDKFLSIMETDPDQYYRVPLKLASKASKASNSGGGLRGLFEGFKETLRSLDPRTAVQYVKERAENFIDGKNIDQDDSIRKNLLWKMTNSFERGESDHRKAYILEKGGSNPDEILAAFETNLEELLLHQTFAYEQLSNLNEIFPMIRATMINIANQGLILNESYQETLDYISKYVRNKIFNQSLVDPLARGFKMALGKLQSGASKLALAFSPAQFYLYLDGLWKDISLFIRKPDGETSFTFKNLKDAFMFAYRDMVFQWGNGRSVTEALNQYYGINDMDMNSYIDKVKSSLGALFNFDSLMFRFASRPDFYNRMTIFTAQMRGDGCWEAHSKGDNGELIYNWEKDKRFDVYVKYRNSKDIPADLRAKFNDLQALYYAMAKLLEKEHTRNKDGSLFKVGDALPKAYTTEQSEGMKALGDMIYGYYSHEKKSMMQSTTIGSMFMLMNTFWSSKKNQFLAPGGIKYMGRMELYAEPEKDENGNIIKDANGNAVMVKYWQVVDADGNLTGEIISDKEKTKDVKAIPFMLWKGQFQEGIFVTLMNLLQSFMHSNEEGVLNKFKDVHNQYWNHPDENLKRAYRSNIKLFWYDLFGWLLIGMIAGPALEKAARDYMKDNGNDSLDEAIVNAHLALGARLVTTSGADFNALKSIGGLGVSWTPFSVQTYTRLIKNVGNVLGGDKSFYDALISTGAATRATRPIWDYVGDTTGWNVARNDEEE